MSDIITTVIMSVLGAFLVLVAVMHLRSTIRKLVDATEEDSDDRRNWLSGRIWNHIALLYIGSLILGVGGSGLAQALF